VQRCYLVKREEIEVDSGGESVRGWAKDEEGEREREREGK
jgi:hypothetical protein